MYTHLFYGRNVHTLDSNGKGGARCRVLSLSCVHFIVFQLVPYKVSMDYAEQGFPLNHDLVMPLGTESDEKASGSEA